MALVIVGNMVYMVIETNHRAVGGKQMPWMVWFTNSLLVIYLVDVVMRIYVLRSDFTKSFMNNFDCCICFLDIALALFEFIRRSQGEAQEIPSLSVLRGLRMLRIVRVLRGFMIFRELYLMMQGLLSALRAIIFGTGLIAVVLTMWGIVAVDLVHKNNQVLAAEGLYGDCDRCSVAFSTVQKAVLTFTTAIIAGDSWGQLSVPLLERYPSTLFVIIPAFLSVQLGLLNVIAAVIVDRQAQARLEDEKLLHTMRQEELGASYKRLAHLFQTMDGDGGGSLTQDELIAAFSTNQEFREIIELMDISQDDLGLVFEILDKDNSGDVSYDEFVHQLDTMKNSNSHTLLVFIRHSTTMLMEKALRNEVAIEELNKRVSSLMLPPNNSPTVSQTEGQVARPGNAEPPQRSAQRTVSQGSSSGNPSQTTTSFLSPAPSQATGPPRRSTKPSRPLKITMIGARGFRHSKKMDCFCTCEIVGRSISQWKSNIAPSTLTPIWNHEFVVEDFKIGEALKFTVINHRTNSFLGKVTVSSNQLSKGGLEGELLLSGGLPYNPMLKIRIEVQRPSVGIASLSAVAPEETLVGEDSEATTVPELPGEVEIRRDSADAVQTPIAHPCANGLMGRHSHDVQLAVQDASRSFRIQAVTPEDVPQVVREAPFVSPRDFSTLGNEAPFVSPRDLSTLGKDAVYEALVYELEHFRKRIDAELALVAANATQRIAEMAVNASAPSQSLVPRTMLQANTFVNGGAIPTPRRTHEDIPPPIEFRRLKPPGPLRAVSGPPVENGFHAPTVWETRPLQATGTAGRSHTSRHTDFTLS
eukprot:TRINITY_DN34544_c0_g1_i1.p1 TRINITY_DN34544_c0_g1~~TRINITY_DN34544_c0_g1_i1.p1  ORF type:complete len:886 (+),score=140.82 TRINITY_DN34544_c0_g1_i1:226-2658(+)